MVEYVDKQSQLSPALSGDKGYTHSDKFKTPTQYERELELYQKPWHRALREWVRHGCPTDRNDLRATKFQMPKVFNSYKENRVMCRFCQIDKFQGQTVACDYCPYATTTEATFVDLAEFFNELR